VYLWPPLGVILSEFQNAVWFTDNWSDGVEMAKEFLTISYSILIQNQIETNRWADDTVVTTMMCYTQHRAVKIENRNLLSEKNELALFNCNMPKWKLTKAQQTIKNVCSVLVML